MTAHTHTHTRTEYNLILAKLTTATQQINKRDKNMDCCSTRALPILFSVLCSNACSNALSDRFSQDDTLTLPTFCAIRQCGFSAKLAQELTIVSRLCPHPEQVPSAIRRLHLPPKCAHLRFILYLFLIRLLLLTSGAISSQCHKRSLASSLSSLLVMMKNVVLLLEIV